MNMSQQQKQLLEKWLKDPSFINWVEKSNTRDYHHWEQYLKDNPQEVEVAQIGKMIIEGIEFNPIKIEEARKHQALERLFKQLEDEKSNNYNNSKDSPRLKPIFRRWSIAATILLLISFSSLIYFQFFHNPQVIIATDFGEQLETVLADGTKVNLNANSTLNFYKKTPRKVWLNGEAFFEVTKKTETSATFEVHTNDLSVVVLGTSFNVKTRGDQTQVFLEEGEVKLNVEDAEQRIIEMSPGDIVSYSKRLKQINENRKGMPVPEIISWKEGTLLFKETPLLKALSEIEAIYGIKFVVKAKYLENELITGGVPSNNLGIALVSLRDIYGLQFEKKGETYIIEGKK